jgi:pimeloyl-ACP methyl ester carboxylesterase
MCRDILTLPSAARLTKYAELQAEDVRYVADCLSKMDAGEQDSIFRDRLLLEIGMGVFGHSYGGPTTAMVLRDDDRFVCGTGLDSAAFGILDSDIGKPFMLLFADPNYNLNAVIGANNSSPTWYFFVDRVVHYDFCDFPFTAINEMFRGPRDAMEMRDLVTSYTKTFFDQHLLKKPVSVESLEFDGVELVKKPGK